ncbi:MAG: hypothetical protein WCJ96_10850 [Verrucomicrobiota bacterium]
MTIFSGYNLGGALADSIQGDRWASLTYLYSPHWYAASRDRSFGADWATRENTGADDAEGRKLWCAGIEHAIRQVLAELPESCVDGLYFDGNPKGSGRTFGELNQKAHEMISFRFRHSQGTA